MKVLFIGTTDILGGAAKVSWELKTRLEKDGHGTSMFVADKRSNDRAVRTIPRSAWRTYLDFALASERLVSTNWILRTKEFKEADVIHCHNLHGRFFNLDTLRKMSLIKPVVWTLHDEWAVTPHCAYTLEGTKMRHGLFECPDINVAPRILWNNSRRLAKRKIRIYRDSNLRVVTPSKWLFDRVKKTPLGEQDVRHIPNGIDTASFAATPQQEAKKALGLPLDKKVVLFLANDAKNNTWKGWKYTEEIIRTYSARTDIMFLSVGNHADHRDEKNVKYVGHVDDKAKLALYYSAADALVFTSIAENFPLVILEAMSCGLPIAAFDVGGVREAVEHGVNGYIAPYRDAPALARELDRLLSLSEDSRSAMRAASAAKARALYDVSGMYKEYMKLYQEITHDRK